MIKFPVTITKPIKVLYKLSCSDVRVYQFYPNGLVTVNYIEPTLDIDDSLIDKTGKFYRSDINSTSSFKKSRKVFLDRVNFLVKKQKDSKKSAPSWARNSYEMPKILKVKRVTS